MLPMYYRRANAAIIVYDVTSEESFSQVTKWINGKCFMSQLTSRVFDKIFSLHQIGSGQALAEPMYFFNCSNHV